MLFRHDTLGPQYFADAYYGIALFTISQMGEQQREIAAKNKEIDDLRDSLEITRSYNYQLNGENHELKCRLAALGEEVD